MNHWIVHLKIEIHYVISINHSVVSILNLNHNDCLVIMVTSVLWVEEYCSQKDNQYINYNTY